MLLSIGSFLLLKKSQCWVGEMVQYLRALAALTETGFSSQDLYGDLQPSGIWMPSSGPYRYQADTWCTYMQANHSYTWNLFFKKKIIQMLVLSREKCNKFTIIMINYWNMLNDLLWIVSVFASWVSCFHFCWDDKNALTKATLKEKELTWLTSLGSGHRREVMGRTWSS